MSDKGKFAEEEAMGYRVEMVGRNLVITEAIRNYFWTKLNKIQRFHEHILDVHCTVDLQKLDYVVVIVLMMNNTKIKVQADCTDLYSSIDRAVDRLEEKVRRWKERIKDHHNKGVQAVDMVVNVIRRPVDEIAEINSEIEAESRRALLEAYRPHPIIGTEKKLLKLLTNNDAVMKMELSDDNFLIYRSVDDQKIRVIYRRSDGNYGLIQPE